MPEQTYDLATPVGRVRLFIPDNRPDKMRFSDAEITVLLEEEGEVPKSAAALGLEILASNKVDTVAYLETYALKVDNTKGAKVLLDRALMLREQALAAIALTGETMDFLFDGEPYL